MRELALEILRMIKGKRFFLSAMLTAAVLWAGIGPDSYWLLQGAEMDVTRLLQNALTSSMNAIALPLLAALPGAALPYQEIRSGAVRNILFRVGMRRYILSRVLSQLFVSAAAQLLGTGGFLLLLGCLTADFAFPAARLLARVLCAAIFTVVGSFGALLTKDATCAYAVPVALCFALSMLRSRFMVEAVLLDPLCWLTGKPDMLFFLCAALSVLVCGYALFLHREVKRNV